MKKKLLFSISILFIFSVCFISCRHITRLDKESYEKDREYLKKLLTDCSVDIAKCIDEGFNIDKLMEEIDNNYKKYENKFDGQEAFGWAIGYSIYKNVPRVNSHNCIKTAKSYYGTTQHFVPFFSTVYFEKNGDVYTVCESGEKNIKPGMIYTGEENLLFKTLRDGKEVYRFGLFIDNFMKNASINVGDKYYKIPLKMAESTANNDADIISFEKRDDNLFIKLNSCDWHTEKEKDDYEQTFKQIGQLLLDEKIDNVIIDLRDNSGGYSDVALWCLYYLLYGKFDNESWEKFIMYERSLDSGSVSLNSEMLRNVVNLKGRSSNDYGRLLMQNADKRYVPLFEDVEEVEKPVPIFNGKIFLITSRYTASCAENIILSIKHFFGEKTVILGLNTCGSFDYSDVFDYFLPESKIALTLSKADKTTSKLLKNNPDWHGDSRGIYPDYWICFDEDSDFNRMIECLE